MRFHLHVVVTVLFVTFVAAALIATRVSAASVALRGSGNTDSSLSASSVHDPNKQELHEPDVIPQNRRRMSQTTLQVPGSFTGMNQEFMDLALLSAKISKCVNKDDPWNYDGCAGAEVFESTWGPDKALVMFSGGICFGAFQATTMTTADWGQNLNPGMAQDVCSPINNICCPSRRGFRDAYKKTSYLEAFETALKTCKTTRCSGGDCQVVLTGTSQGGAIALIGGVYLNPDAVFTYGQPPTMEEPCYAYDTKRYYRFVNTEIQNGNLVYDIVPFLSFGATDHMGHLFALGEDTRNVAYYKDHEAPDIPPVDWALWKIQAAHSIDSYIDRLEKLQVSPGLDGWAIGQRCTDLSSECAAPHMCGQGRCSSGENEERCDSDRDCLSGRCDGWFPHRCMSKLSDGSFCNESSDCKSNRCGWTWTGVRCK